MSLIAIFSWVIAATVRASLLVLVVLVLQRTMRSWLSARWKYALWTPVLLVILIPPQPLIPSWAWNSTGESQAPSQVDSTPSVVSRPSSANFVATRVVGEDADIALRVKGIEVSGSVAAGYHLTSWLEIVAMGWLLGALVASVFVWIAYTSKMHRIRRRATTADRVDLARIKSLAEEFGLRKCPQVLLSSEVKAPAVCGVLRPRLLLNESFFQMLSREEADFVLRHELMHIRRRDVLVNFALFGFVIVHWFNPLLWFAFFRAGADREAACDEDVLRTDSPVRRVAYGKTLLRMEAELSQPGLCLGFVGMLQKGKRVRDRIEFISNPKRMGMPARSLALFCMFVITILGIAKSADPQSKPEMQQFTSAKEEPEGKEQHTNAETPQSKQSSVGYRLVSDKDGKVRTVEVIRKDNVMRLLDSGKAKKEEFSSIDELGKLPDLSRLTIVYGSRLTNDDLKAISTLPRIVEIEIGFPSIASEYVTIEGGTAPLGQLKTLEVVRLCKDGIRDEDLRFVSQLPRLHTLEFRADNGRENVRCTDKCADHLFQARQLRHLTIHGDSFTEDFFEGLDRGLPKLKTLELNSGMFTDVSQLPIGTRNEIAKLQGNWRLIALRIGARAATEKSIANTRVLIEGNAISMNGSREGLFQYRIDETARPKKIDIPTEREPLKAIYKLNGDRLELTVPQSEGGERPSSTDTEGTTNVRMTLERMKP